MTHRTTLALDEITVNRIRKLAGLWGLSQSAAVRRAVELAERTAEVQKNAPLERLEAYHRQGGLDALRADAYLREVAEDRAAWRDDR